MLVTGVQFSCPAGQQVMERRLHVACFVLSVMDLVAMYPWASTLSVTFSCMLLILTLERAGVSWSLSVYVACARLHVHGDLSVYVGPIASMLPGALPAGDGATQSICSTLCRISTGHCGGAMT